VAGTPGHTASTALLLAGLVLPLALPTAAAHARPATTEPAPGASLDAGPDRVRIRFTETPDPAETELRLLSAGGNLTPVETGPVEVNGSTAQVTVPSRLDPGGYVVRWATLSEVDGHRTSGSWGFAVGSAEAPSAATEATVEAPGTPPNAVLGKALLYVGLAILVGGLAFQLLVRPSHEETWFQLLLPTGAGLHLLGVAVFAGSQVTLSPSGLPGYIVGTLFGRGIAARLGLTVAELGLVLRARRLVDPRRAGALAVLLLGSLGLQGFFSHATGVLGPVAGTLLHGVHLAAVTAWVGGLACLVFTLRDAERDRIPPDAAEAAGQRFSDLATAVIALLVATGLPLLLGVVGTTPRELVAAWGTDYGRFLYLKIGLFVPMVALGGWNRVAHVGDAPPTLRRLATRLAGALGGGASRLPGFRRSVAREALVAVAVFALAAAATNLSPPADVIEGPAQAGSPEGRGPDVVHRNLTGDLYAYEIVSDPAPRSAQPTNLSVTLHEGNLTGPPVDAFRVTVGFNHTRQDIGSEALPMEAAGNGTYWAAGAFFPVAGAWNVTVTVTTDEVYKKAVTVPFEVR
jgi:copper transport protein